VCAPAKLFGEGACMASHAVTYVIPWPVCRYRHQDDPTARVPMQSAVHSEYSAGADFSMYSVDAWNVLILPPSHNNSRSRWWHNYQHQRKMTSMPLWIPGKPPPIPLPSRSHTGLREDYRPAQPRRWGPVSKTTLFAGQLTSARTTFFPGRRE